MKLFGKILLKLAALFAFPFFILIFVCYALMMVIINFIAFCKDKSNLDYREADKRQNDRENSCLHECAKLLLGYWKFIFLDWK